MRRRRRPKLARRGRSSFVASFVALFTATCLVASLAACDDATTDGGGPANARAGTPTDASKSAAPARTNRPAPPIFVDVAREAGLVATNHTGIPNQKDWIASGIGGGAIVLDYDQDGRMD